MEGMINAAKGANPLAAPGVDIVDKCLGIDLIGMGKGAQDKVSLLCYRMVDKLFSAVPKGVENVELKVPPICLEVYKFASSDKCKDKVGCAASFDGNPPATPPRTFKIQNVARIHTCTDALSRFFSITLLVLVCL